MTKEEIEARIVELKKLHTEALANLNAIGGAIQDCEFWLKRVIQQEAERSKE